MYTKRVFRGVWASALVLMLITAYSTKAQHVYDSLTISSIEKELYNAVYVNLVSYMIHQNALQNQEAYKQGLYIDGLVGKYYTPILSCGDSVSVERYNIKFRLSSLRLPEGFYISSYKVIEFSWWGMESIIQYANRRMTSAPVNNPLHSPLMQKGLIAINPKNNSDIYFLSGYIFLHNIGWLYFPKGHIDETMLRDYIDIRYYNYEPTIEHIDSEKGECLFYSEIMRKKYRVQIIHEADEYEGKDYGVTYDEITALPKAQEKE